MYSPGAHECERASNAYLMSLAAAFAGMPLPIVNLLATIGFYLGNRKSTPFVKWHSTQALLSQLLLFPINAGLMIMSIQLLFGEDTISNQYIGYLIAVILVNLADLVCTVYAADAVRKGRHVRWWFLAEITDRLQPEYLNEEATPVHSLNPFYKH